MKVTHVSKSKLFFIKIVEKGIGFQNSILTHSEFSQTPVIQREGCDLPKYPYFNENLHFAAYWVLREKCHNSEFFRVNVFPYSG